MRWVVISECSRPMTVSPFDAGCLVDLERYPLHELESAQGNAFLVRCRAELAESGACNLQGFIREGEVADLAAEALALLPLAYVKNTRRNAYFTEDDPALPADHPLRAFFPLKMSQLANDAIPQSAAIQRLYGW